MKAIATGVLMPEALRTTQVGCSGRHNLLAHIQSPDLNVSLRPFRMSVNDGLP
jgi:hypothetical protein